MSSGSISSSESVDHIPLASMEAGNSANVNDPTVRYDVFLSYADEDSEFAKEMMKRLREAHLRVFIPSDGMFPCVCMGGGGGGGGGVCVCGECAYVHVSVYAWMYEGCVYMESVCMGCKGVCMCMHV